MPTVVQMKNGPEKIDPENLPADPESVAFQRFDAEDDQQILAQIQGRNLEILDRLVYSYTDRRGAAITGLSLTGVRETVREMNRRGLARIRVTSAPPIITETDDYIDAIVYAEDELNGGGSWGAKRQGKRAGNYVNPFALEQAISKAQRNAMFALIPAAYVAEMIREYVADGRAHEIKTGSARIAELPGQNAPRSPGRTDRPAEAPADGSAAPELPLAAAVPSRADLATESQIRFFRSLLQRNDLDEAETLRKIGVNSVHELTKQRVSQLIDRLVARAETQKASA